MMAMAMAVTVMKAIIGRIRIVCKLIFFLI